MSSDLNAAKIVVGSYTGLRGTLGICLFILSAAPAGASTLSTLFPVMTAAGTLMLISYGILEGRRWGWTGGFISLSVLMGIASFQLYKTGNGPPVLPMVDVLVLTLAIWKRDIIETDSKEKKLDFDALGM